jgi:hypothetical protein
VSPEERLREPPPPEPAPPEPAPPEPAPPEPGPPEPAPPEPPLQVLARWEEAGAVWRTRRLTDAEAVVDLCACTGEKVDELRSSDPELLRHLAVRPRSDEA